MASGARSLQIVRRASPALHNSCYPPQESLMPGELLTEFMETEVVVKIEYLLRRTSILSVDITPLPDGVQLDFKAILADRIDIVIYEARTSDYHTDSNTDGTFAALRIALALEGGKSSGRRRFSERLESSTFFKFKNNTEYWIEFSCPDIDSYGNKYGYLRHYRKFRTYTRSFWSFVENIIVDDDSDDIGGGEIDFFYSVFDAVSKRQFSFDTAISLGGNSGDRYDAPFNQSHYEYPWKEAPRSVALVFWAREDDYDSFDFGLTLFNTYQWKALGTFSENETYEWSSNTLADSAGVIYRTELRSDPGKDRWKREIRTHPKGRLRFRFNMDFECVVEATEQPSFKSWRRDKQTIFVGRYEASGNSDQNSTFLVGMANVPLSSGTSINMETDLNGRSIITHSRNNVHLDGIIDASVAIKTILFITRTPDETGAFVYAITWDENLIRGDIKLNPMRIEWSSKSRDGIVGGPVKLGTVRNAALIYRNKKKQYKILRPSGQIEVVASDVKEAFDDFRGVLYNNDWLVWAFRKADGNWHALGDRTGKLFGKTLPAELGAPLEIGMSKKKPVIYGVDERMNLQVWGPGLRAIENLGLIDAIIDQARPQRKRPVRNPPPKDAPDKMTSAQ